MDFEIYYEGVSMSDEEIEQKFKETYPDLMRGDTPLSPYFDIWCYAIEIMEQENEELKDKLNNWVKCAELRLANWQKYETENNKLLDVINGQDVKIADLEKKNSFLSDNLRVARKDRERLELEIGKGLKEYLKDCPYTSLKFYADNKYVEQLEQAKVIIKRLLSLYFYPVVTDKDLKRKDEIIEQAEQFIGEKK